MAKNEEKNIPYSGLEQKERIIKPLIENKQTSRKQKIAWFLGFLSLLSLDAVFIKELNDIQNDIDVKSAYVRTIDTLETQIPNEISKINAVRFSEPKVGQPSEVQVFATLEKENSATLHYNYFYELAYDYYQNLKTAETAGNFKKYVDVLNLCLQNMELKNSTCSYSTTNFKFNNKEVEKFNELFNLNKYGLNQSGFLPQFVDYSVNFASEFNPITNSHEETKYVTYVIKGLSFVDTTNNEKVDVLPSELSYKLLNEKLNNKSIKIYETDFTLTYEKAGNLTFDPNELLDVLKAHFNGTELAKNLKVVPTYAHEIDLSDLNSKQKNLYYDLIK